MIKKKDPSQEDKKTWEEYIKNPSDIYDKDHDGPKSIQVPKADATKLEVNEYSPIDLFATK